jgi:hypothetical protein
MITAMLRQRFSERQVDSIKKELWQMTRGRAIILNSPPPRSLKLSVKELSFDKQGGFRCVTGSADFESVSGAKSSSFEKPCHIENEEAFILDPDEKLLSTRGSRFKKLTCSWFTVTSVEFEKKSPRTLHISVNQNETGKKKEAYLSVNHNSDLTIIQSAE